MKKIFSGVRDFFAARPEALLLLFWPVHELFYITLNSYTPMLKPYIIYSPLDDLIPFVEYFIVPYDMWFFYIAAVSLYFLWKNRRDYLRMSFMLITGVVVSMLICFFFPSMHELRPAAFANDNIFTKLVESLYAIDQPAVIFPSMHVIVSILLAVSVFASESLGKNRPVKTGASVLSLLICAATVFIKQHSILDVIFGVALSVPIALAGTLLPRFRRKDPASSEDRTARR